MKICTKCKEEKELKSFHKSSRNKDGRYSSCKKCRKEQDSNFYNKNRDKISKRNKKWKSENPKKVDVINKRYRDNNKEKISERYKNWRSSNLEYARENYKIWRDKNLEHRKSYEKEWWSRNKELLSFYGSKRRSAKKQATPKWVDLEKIKEVYMNKPKGFHVDHIIPLQSDIVCGLHVHWNLQYLTKEENLSKGNKLLDEHLGGN